MTYEILLFMYINPRQRYNNIGLEPIVIMAFSECLYRRSLFMKISIANEQTINQERRSPYAFLLFLHSERV